MRDSKAASDEMWAIATDDPRCLSICVSRLRYADTAKRLVSEQRFNVPLDTL